MKLSPEQIRAFRRTVMRHYREHGRRFAWRSTRDPYRILVSEFMLQQTQTSRVADRYSLFLARFPNFRALASAPAAEVIRAWQGLGYNRRALALKKTAEIVVRDYGGKLPRAEVELRALPGVGPYTAAALRAFVFGEPVEMIETNIRAAHLLHFFPGKRAVPERALLQCVGETLDRRDPRRWYYALMDYGTAVRKLHRTINRRSLRYRKQERFEGSNRQLRGELVRMIANCAGISLKMLARRINRSERDLSPVLERLAAEGFVQCRRGRWTLGG